MPQAIVRTLLGALLPGLGLVIGGRKRLGWFVLTVSIGLLLSGAYLGLAQRDWLLSLAVSPGRLLVAAVLVVAQRDLVGSVFQSEGNSKSATRPKVNAKDPWATTPRLNILLLGAYHPTS